MEMFRLRIARLLCSGHIVSITSNERLADTYPLSAEQNFTNQVKARRSGQTSPPVPKTLGNRSSSLSRASGLEQEPRATLGLIDPVFQQARGGNVAVFVAKAVDLAQVVCQLLVVIAQLGKHIHRRVERSGLQRFGISKVHMLSPSMVFIPEALSCTPSRSSFNWQEGVGPDNAHRQSCLQKQLCAD